jgi:hypothetical protein
MSQLWFDHALVQAINYFWVHNLSRVVLGNLTNQRRPNGKCTSALSNTYDCPCIRLERAKSYVAKSLNGVFFIDPPDQIPWISR